MRRIQRRLDSALCTDPDTTKRREEYYKRIEEAKGNHRVHGGCCQHFVFSHFVLLLNEDA
jgi:hypothetical protein